MTSQVSFILGAERGEHVRVDILRRANGGATDYWDGNWVAARILVRAGGFRGGVEANLRTTDFSAFREQLQVLYTQLTGGAAFETMEESLALRVAGDGRGHISLTGELTDSPGSGNRLLFSVPDLDQTDLLAVISALCEIEDAYPTIGSPAA